MVQEIFKDIDLITRINFRTLIVKNIRKKLIDNGWIIEEQETEDGVTVRLYENNVEKEWDSFLYEETAETSDIALKNSLKIISDHYKKILAN